jgi:tetratricopeptide (TPR) repeat protein
VEPVAEVVTVEQPVEAAPEPEAAVEPTVEPPAPAAEVIEPALAVEPGAAVQPVEEPSQESPAPGPVAEVAYEEFLQDDREALSHLAAAPRIEPQEPSTTPEPLQKIDASGEFQIQMDTKNAHVWNELGNVYFNNGAVDDSIVAYSKAIELDRWFAWPYSNLALAYVQKGRFAEAVLLYQRSIELFNGEKDKAVSWNRLGNVYRRMSDYENAIAAYQRADELDPDNTALSLQSRFSLLGSFQAEPSYAAA